MRQVHKEAIRLYDNITRCGSSEIAHKIVFGIELSPNATVTEMADWVNHVSSELERGFDEATIKAIRMGCYCDEDGKLDESKRLIKEIFDVSESMDDFVARMNAQNVGWYMEGGFLFAKYFSCSCPMLEGIDRLATKTWCYCTVGFNRHIFEHVFGCRVDVELLESIKMGHEQCLMKIVPCGSIKGSGSMGGNTN